MDFRTSKYLRRLDRDAYAVLLSIVFRYVVLLAVLLFLHWLPVVEPESMRLLALVGMSANTIFLAALLHLYYRGAESPSATVSNVFLWTVFLFDQTALSLGMIFSGGLYSPYFPLLLLGVVGMVILKGGTKLSWLRLAAWCYPLVAFTASTALWILTQPHHWEADATGIGLLLGLKLVMLGGAIVTALLLNSYNVQLTSRALETIQEESHRRVALEQELAQKDKLASAGTLVAGVAHELNNPLAVILGTSQLMLGRERFGEDVRRLARIKHAAQRCQEIVDSLRVLAYQRKVTRRDLRLQQIIDHVVDALRERFEERQVSVSVEIPEGLRVFGNAVELERVFCNLMTNALQALVEGRPGEVRITAARRGRRVDVRVTDNGRGMTGDVLRRVFEPFFTTKGVGGGLGLGLAMVYRIVERMGGKVLLESVPDEGTAITVDLPLGETSARREDASDLEIPRGDLLRGRTVLAMESDRGRLGTLIRACRQWGAEVQVTTVEDGTVQLQEGAWDLVLSDVGPPESRLWSWLFAIVERRKRGDVEVLVAVDEHEDPEVIRFLDANTVSRLPLPVETKSQQLALARLTATATVMSADR
jgi:signal transduction histidine kinase